MRSDSLVNCSVVIVSPERWDSHTVSKHHYAITLAERGFNVFFLNPPDDSATGISIEMVEEYPGLHVVSNQRIAPGLRFFPGFFRRWLEKRWLMQLERLVSTRIDVVWLFENSRFFDMRFAGDRLKIYHQVDLNQNFHPQTSASTADICFCTSDFIREELLPYSANVYKIHHGTAQLKSEDSLSKEQEARFKPAVPHAVYIGNLDMLYLDTKLLAETVKRFTDVQFHFVGGYQEASPLRQLTGNLGNVMWWGKLESTLIPTILEKADILLVTYKAEKYDKQLASPHKFMEYLASGKAIVATYTDEYKDKRDLLEMVDDSDDYAAVFDKVVNNLEAYNGPEKQAQRIEYAQAHSYDKQLDKIVSLLKKHHLIDENMAVL